MIRRSLDATESDSFEAVSDRPDTRLDNSLERFQRPALDGRRSLGTRVDLLGSFQKKNSTGESRGYPAPRAFPKRPRLQPEPLARWGLEQRRKAAFRREGTPSDLGLELSQGIRPTESERRAIPTRPEPASVRHDEDRPPSGGESAPALVQKPRRIFAGLQSVQQNQFVDEIVRNRPERLLAKNGDVRKLRRPGHCSLLRWH